MACVAGGPGELAHRVHPAIAPFGTSFGSLSCQFCASVVTVRVRVACVPAQCCSRLAFRWHTVLGSPE